MYICLCLYPFNFNSEKKYSLGDFEHGLMWFNRGLRNPELLMSEREEILVII